MSLSFIFVSPLLSGATSFLVSGSDTLDAVYKVLSLLQETQNKYLKLLFPSDISHIDYYLIVPWDCIQEELNTFCLLFYYMTSPENKHNLVLLKETFWRQHKGCVHYCGLWILCLEPAWFSFDIESQTHFFSGFVFYWEFTAFWSEAHRMFWWWSWQFMRMFFVLFFLLWAVLLVFS